MTPPDPQYISLYVQFTQAHIQHAASADPIGFSEVAARHDADAAFVALRSHIQRQFLADLVEEFEMDGRIDLSALRAGAEKVIDKDLRDTT